MCEIIAISYRDESLFPWDWIDPEEGFHWCASCGQYLTVAHGRHPVIENGKLIDPGELKTCGYCRYKIGVGDMLCGICGEQAEMWDIGGARCRKHEWQEGTDEGYRGENFCYGTARIRDNYPFEEAEKAQQKTLEDHKKFYAEFIAGCQKRKDSGIPPRNWKK